MTCNDPLHLVHSLSDTAMEALLTDIEGYVELEKRKSGRFKLFWESLVELVKFEIVKRRIPSSSFSAMHHAVNNDVKGLLEGKSSGELKILVDDILKKLSMKETCDTEYWELMVKEIRFELNRKTFDELYGEILTRQDTILSQMRASIRLAGGHKGDKPEDSVDEGLVAGDLDDSEERMEQADEISLPVRKYTWQDKYRPRKPRYFNRVSRLIFVYYVPF